MRGPLVFLKPLLWLWGGGALCEKSHFWAVVAFSMPVILHFFLIFFSRGGVGPLPVKATECISLLAVFVSFLLLQRAPMFSALEVAKCCYEQYKG